VALLGIKRLLVYRNSVVVINQVNKSWDRNKENMDAYCLEVRKLENKFYVLSSITSSTTAMLQRMSYRSLVLLALKYQRVSSSTSFTRHPSRSRLLGNSGKPVTLETSRLMKFVMQVIRGNELTKIWSLEFTKSRSHECAVNWTPELSKSRSHERAMARSLEPAWP
jgi:hypothetical protein